MNFTKASKKQSHHIQIRKCILLKIKIYLVRIREMRLLGKIFINLQSHQ